MRAGRNHVQRLHVAREAPLSLDLQKARHVRLRQIRHFDMRRQSPLQRQANDALPLAHTAGVQVVANLAPDQFGIIGQGIQCQRDRKGLLDAQGSVRAPNHEAVQAAPVQAQSEDG